MGSLIVEQDASSRVASLAFGFDGAAEDAAAQGLVGFGFALGENAEDSVLFGVAQRMFVG